MGTTAPPEPSTDRDPYARPVIASCGTALYNCRGSAGAEQRHVVGLQNVHGLCDGWPLAPVRVRAPEADDQHALHLPKLAVLLVIVVAPQPRVDCVKDTAPAVQVPHPFQQNNKKPSGVSVTGPSLPSARISA